MTRDTVAEIVAVAGELVEAVDELDGMRAPPHYEKELKRASVLADKLQELLCDHESLERAFSRRRA